MPKKKYNTDGVTQVKTKVKADISLPHWNRDKIKFNLSVLRIKGSHENGLLRVCETARP